MHWLEINLMNKQQMVDHLVERRGEFLTFNIGHLLILIGISGGVLAVWNHEQTQLQDHERRLITAEQSLIRSHDEDQVWQRTVIQTLQTIQADIGYIKGRQSVPQQRGDSASPKSADGGGG